MVAQALHLSGTQAPNTTHAPRATQVVSETLPAVAELRAQGLVKAVGFSCLPLKVVKYVLDRVPPGARPAL